MLRFVGQWLTCLTYSLRLSGLSGRPGDYAIWMFPLNDYIPVAQTTLRVRAWSECGYNCSNSSTPCMMGVIITFFCCVRVLIMATGIKGVPHRGAGEGVPLPSPTLPNVAFCVRQKNLYYLRFVPNKPSLTTDKGGNTYFLMQEMRKV